MTKFSIAIALLVFSFLLCYISHASATVGTATFYDPPYTPSSCYGNENKGTLIAAASNAIWDHRAACGRKYRVKCIGATNQGGFPCRVKESVVVTVVDYCPPSGCHATIDLSKEAFAAIANPDAGKIDISYTLV